MARLTVLALGARLGVSLSAANIWVVASPSACTSYYMHGRAHEGWAPRGAVRRSVERIAQFEVERHTTHRYAYIYTYRA